MPNLPAVSASSWSIVVMLTHQKIEHLKPEVKTKRYSDRDGLALEVRPSGNKVFIFRFQWLKKPQTITLGRFPALSLIEARNLAAVHRAKVNNGIDPREDERAAEQRIQNTFESIAEQWYAKNLPRWRVKTSKKHKRSLERDIYPLIGNQQINDITRANLLQVFHPHEALGHHEIAHRLHDRIKAIFDFALAAGITENYPFNGLKKALTPKPKIKNQLAISPNEAHEMLDKIRQSTASKITKLYIELLAHLFVRPSELRLAQWSEFNLQQAEWHIPTERMKMAAPHWVPLSAPALAILRELRLITGFTPYLFSSPGSKHQPISETSARKLLHATGYKDRHTLHGFRSLASTLLHSESPFRSDAIEAQLAHKVQGVRGVYMRADFKQERRKLMEWHSKWIMKTEISPSSLISNINAD